MKKPNRFMRREPTDGTKLEPKIRSLAHPLRDSKDLDALLDQIGNLATSCWARPRMALPNTTRGERQLPNA